MSSLLFAFVAVLLGSFGGRDQLIVAQVSGASRRGPGVLCAAIASATLSAVVMALAGQAVSTMLPGPGKTMLVAIALLFASLELAWPVKQARAKEPTRSVAAILIVLVVKQFGDGARFLVFAIAAATGAPLLAGLGGAAGGTLALLAAWALGEQDLARLPMRPLRLALAGIALLAAIVIGLGARGIIE